MRHLIAICLLLLAGATVNVAVAWSCAIWDPVDLFNWASPVQSPVTQPAAAPDHWPPLRYVDQAARGGRTLTVYTDKRLPSCTMGMQFVQLCFHDAGWPARSMRWRDYWDMRSNATPLEEIFLFPGDDLPIMPALLQEPAPPARDRLLPEAERIGTYEYHLAHPQWSLWATPPKWLPGAQPSRALPLRPLPLGFVVNTGVYAAALWAPFAPFALRRVIRRRRAMCVRCGYPRGASDVCTECGAAL